MSNVCRILPAPGKACSCLLPHHTVGSTVERHFDRRWLPLIISQEDSVSLARCVSSSASVFHCLWWWWSRSQQSFIAKTPTFVQLIKGVAKRLLVSRVRIRSSFLARVLLTRSQAVLIKELHSTDPSVVMSFLQHSSSVHLTNMLSQAV